jgi:hypothetical protein
LAIGKFGVKCKVAEEMKKSCSHHGFTNSAFPIYIFFVHFIGSAYFLLLDWIEKPWQILLIIGIKKGFLLS